MRNLLIRILFRLIDRRVDTRLSENDKTNLQLELANLHKSVVFLRWLNEKEKFIFSAWKSGLEKNSDILKGRLLELESIRKDLRECSHAQKKGEDSNPN